MRGDSGDWQSNRRRHDVAGSTAGLGHGFLDFPVASSKNARLFSLVTVRRNESNEPT
ncbi:hypothetical protein FRUB_05143 [Fimbriiglobus ruber]|uniref:Uncharacterized protein n=1 Tax=Fimbriiglobus ruber TaxID=1908690 RepID=A0A225DKP6_9BACT|nr:hypothetical protein FRUB_05143 [Fimbriiglobus ruber]